MAGTIAVPTGVTLSGAGKKLTIIRSSKNVSSVTTRVAIVGLSGGCTVEGLSIESTNPSFGSGNRDCPIGHGGYSGGGDLFATLRELHVSGKSDALFFSNSGSAKICISAYDCDFTSQADAMVFNGGTGSSLLLYNVNATADGPGGEFDVSAFRGYGTAYSLFWYGGSAFAHTTSAKNAAALLLGAQRIRLWGVKLASTTADAGGQAYDVVANTTGIIAVFYGVSYNPAKVGFPENIAIFSDPVLSPTTHTIASDAITVALPDKLNYERVDTASGPANLATINNGQAGQILVLRNVNTSRKVTVKDGAGNLSLAGDYKLATSENAIGLLAISTSDWIELFRSPVLAPSTYTIATGAITVDLPNQTNYHLVDTGGGPANLSTINGAEQGKILILKAANDSNTVTLIDGTNLRLAGGNFALDNVEDSIGLIAYSDSVWHELFRSNNGS